LAERYIGLISGTSVDGVDAVIAEFDDRSCRIIAAATTPYPASLSKRVWTLIERPVTDLASLGATDVLLGRFFADCVSDLLARADLAPAAITAIGHHGQTIFHQPTGSAPFTLQIGDPNVLVARTGITTVADFRRLDIALGGQGAPLVPAFHDWLFRDVTQTRVVLNIGGIANVTLLVPGEAITGFDTGPGNTLSDAWIRRCQDKRYDDEGAWAATGSVIPELLTALLEDPYFERAGPKSTGPEHFNLAWLDKPLAVLGSEPDAADVQATLVELTAQSIARAILRAEPGFDRVIVCGGGAHNTHLMARLRAALRNRVETSQVYGVDPDWIEALAFAWFARARLRNDPSNVPTVTGAREAVSLGGIYSLVTGH
jgi:anhydro-N-acetylmuramic acid kinase